MVSSFGPTTATGLSQLLEGEVSHDQVTKFLSSPAKTSADLWRVVKALVREVEDDDGVLIIDDSIEEKPYTDENELICWHWDHSKERHVKGINFLTAFYAAEKFKLPVAFDLVTKTETYFDPKAGKQKRRSAISKNERARMLLHVCIHNQIRFRYVLADLWYASADNMKYIHHVLSKLFVLPLKTNRKVALSLEEKQRGQYGAVGTLDLPAGITHQVWLEEVDFPLLLVKQVFTNEDGSVGIRYLVTDDLTLNYDRITTLYQRRWSVEPVIGHEKQDHGLRRNHLKGQEGDRINALLSGCGFNLRKLLRAFSCALEHWLSGLVFKPRAGLQPFRGRFADI